MSHYYQRRRRRRRSRSYFFPFILLIAVIAAAYFLVKGVGFLFSIQVDDPEITLYIEQGSVTLKPADDQTQALTAISTQKVLPGDVVETGIGTRAVLDFFGSVQVRLAPSSELVVTEAMNTKRDQVILGDLLAGSAWVNIYNPDQDKESDFKFRTPNLLTEAVGTKYALKAKLPEVVRVYGGEVSVGVLDPEKADGESVLETTIVSIAQQFELTASDLSAFQKRETPSVLSAIDEEFEQTSWFEWNSYLDSNMPLVMSFDGNSPIANVGVPGGLALFAEDQAEDEANTADEDSENTDEDTTDEDTDTTDENSDATDEDEELEYTKLPVPVVVRPSDDSEIDEDVVIIEGTVADGAYQIEVTSFEKGFANSYILQRFEPGDATWRYVATVDGGNLVEGENKFEIRTVNQAGDKSKAVKITINYEPVVIEEDPDDSGVDIDPTTDPDDTANQDPDTTQDPDDGKITPQI